MSADFDDIESYHWEIRRGTGPVLATAVHAGHLLRPEVQAHAAITDEQRLHEEDPLTDVLASVGDQVFVTRTSRFEVDLNRPENEAVYRVPSDAWGLDMWHGDLPDATVERSLAQRTRFYELMARWLEELIDEHGAVLLLDVHSFNHRREDDDGERSAEEAMPDIDLGLSTADRGRFGSVIDAFRSELSNSRIGGRCASVGDNVRFPDGGNWPEWVFAEYGDHVCTITLEYKKVFMDERSGTADIAALLSLHAGLERATDVARTEIS